METSTEHYFAEQQQNGQLRYTRNVFLSKAINLVPNESIRMTRIPFLNEQGRTFAKLIRT